MQHTVHQRLCLVRLSHIVIKVSNMVARLVTVRILSYQSGNIYRYRLALQGRICHEQRIELTDECVTATHEFHQTIYIVRYEPSPLPGSAFTVIIVAVSGSTRIERRTPIALAVEPAHKTGRRIEIYLIALCKSRVLSPVRLIAHCFSQL